MTRKICAALALSLATLAAIDAGAAEPRPDAPTTLPIVKRADWGSKPQPFPDSKRHTPRLITIHHAGEMWYAGSDPLDKARRLQR
ncbi:hypothetical protein EON77_16825, partial [bacterium]